MSVISGRAWKFGDDINTDLIIPGHAMFLKDSERRRCLFQVYRPGWVEQVRDGDILIAGRSFGTGSSRPASLVLKQAGIQCLIAESVGKLFFRNSVSYGLPTLECPGVTDAFEEGQTARVDWTTFTVTNETTGAKLNARSVPASLLEMMQSGGILPLLRSQGYVAPAGEDDGGQA